VAAGPWTFQDSTWRTDIGAEGTSLTLSLVHTHNTHTHTRYGSLLITVMRALAFAHNGRQPLLHRCGVPVVKRMTVLPRTDASTFYKRVGFNPLCGVYTWFPQDPLLLSRFRLEHLWDDSPHHPVHTHYTRTRACAHVTHTHTYSSRRRWCRTAPDQAISLSSL